MCTTTLMHIGKLYTLYFSAFLKLKLTWSGGYCSFLSFRISITSRKMGQGIELLPREYSDYLGTSNDPGNVEISWRFNIYLHICADLHWTQYMYCQFFFSFALHPSLLFFFSSMAEHWVTVFHLIKSSGWHAQMLCRLHLKEVLTFGE